MTTSARSMLRAMVVVAIVLSAHTKQNITVYAQSEKLDPTWVELARAPQQPPLLLPFAAEEKWWYSGAPHGAYGKVGPFAAVDFANPTRDGCQISQEWVLASAPGVVTTSGNGEVTTDLDGDGDPNNSWSLFYFHMSDTDRIPVGTEVKTGDRIGRVDCMYGKTNGSHLHFARRYKGAFVPVNDPSAPMNLSGWSFQSTGSEYIGYAKHAELGRLGASCCQDDELDSLITSNNDAANRQKVFNNPVLAGQKFFFSLPVSWFKPRNIVLEPDLVDGFRDGRLEGKDGWKLPVASNLISSTEDDHTQCIEIGPVKTGRCSVNAWDLSAVQLAAVRAAAPGVVEYAGCNNAGNYGCWVWIKHPDGRYTVYAHLVNERDPSFKIPSGSEGDPQGYVMVKKDQKVDAWTVLGRVGMTGKTGWSHVHFEIRDANQKQVRVDKYFDPKLMEYRLSGSTKDWPWDVPYQGNNPMQSRLSLVQSFAVGPTLLFLFILLVMIAVVVVPVRLMGKITRYFMKGKKKGSLGELYVQFGVIGAQAMMVSFLFGMSVRAVELGALQFVRNYTNLTYNPSALEKLLGVSRVYAFEVPATGLFTPVWGWPCTDGGPGTLGNTCTPSQIVGAGRSWASAVEGATSRSATPVVVPVLHSGFGMNEFAKLIPTAHANGTMVLIDTSGKVEDLRKAIKQLTPLGLDGIVVDQEHNKAVRFSDVKQLGIEFARARSEAGLKGDGIVLVWDVFHSIPGSNADFGGVAGVKFVVINDGFGGSSAKWESFEKTRAHYGVSDNNRVGIMFFDRRWPVNTSCTSSNNTSGYDCQSWKTMLELHPQLATLGWLAQQ